MARWAIGDVQGCDAELAALLHDIQFNVDRDELWLTGDLVNRGPDSLRAMRRIRDIGANAIMVLGNHDLHLLALAFGTGRRPRRSDTLTEVLAARDRDRLLEWLITRPLVWYDESHADLLVHAGLVPVWTATRVVALAHEVEAALRADPPRVFDSMYGDEPDVWDDGLEGEARWRFVINVLTRMRVCTAKGRIDVRQKGPPGDARPPWLPWFDVPRRASAGVRVVFGHWSALGLLRRRDVVALDTGCVWGGTLTAVNLDDPDREPISVRSRRTAAVGID